VFRWRGYVIRIELCSFKLRSGVRRIDACPNEPAIWYLNSWNLKCVRGILNSPSYKMDPALRLCSGSWRHQNNCLTRGSKDKCTGSQQLTRSMNVNIILYLSLNFELNWRTHLSADLWEVNAFNYKGKAIHVEISEHLDIEQPLSNWERSTYSSYNYFFLHVLCLILASYKLRKMFADRSGEPIGRSRFRAGPSFSHNVYWRSSSTMPQALSSLCSLSTRVQ
jgi:hypothetical protein